MSSKSAFIPAMNSKILVLSTFSWCMGGDFNEVLYFEERNKGSRRTGGMELFCAFENQNNLNDIPIPSTRLWSNFQDEAMRKTDSWFRQNGRSSPL